MENGKAKNFVVLTSLKAKAKQRWYVDSGSSRHMIWNKHLLKNIQQCSLNCATFGDGVIRSILGWFIKYSRDAKIRNVLLVEGLKANLISIILLCDQNLFAKFTKDKCFVLDQSDGCIMEGSGSSNNCYFLSSSYLNTT